MTRKTTTAPHRTATRHHLQDLIGQVVTARFITRPLPGTLAPDPDPRHVRVRVMDIATPYGVARLLVTPENGTGEAWISADKLTEWEEPTT